MCFRFSGAEDTGVHGSLIKVESGRSWWSYVRFYQCSQKLWRLPSGWFKGRFSHIIARNWLGCLPSSLKSDDIWKPSQFARYRPDQNVVPNLRMCRGPGRRTEAGRGKQAQVPRAMAFRRAPSGAAEKLRQWEGEYVRDFCLDRAWQLSYDGPSLPGCPGLTGAASVLETARVISTDSAGPSHGLKVVLQPAPRRRRQRAWLWGGGSRNRTRILLPVTRTFNGSNDDQIVVKNSQIIMIAK